MTTEGKPIEEKLKFIAKSFSETVQSKGSADEAMKKQLDHYKKENGELRSQFDTEKSNYETKTKELETDFKNKSVRMNFNNFLNNNYNLQEAYNKGAIKNGIYEDIWKQVSEKANITEELSLVNKEDNQSPVFDPVNKSKQLTLKDLTDTHMSDYVKKGTPEPGPRKNPDPDPLYHGERTSTILKRHDKIREQKLKELAGEGVM